MLPNELESSHRNHLPGRSLYRLTTTKTRLRDRRHDKLCVMDIVIPSDSQMLETSCHFHVPHSLPFLSTVSQFFTLNDSLIRVFVHAGLFCCLLYPGTSNFTHLKCLFSQNETTFYCYFFLDIVYNFQRQNINSEESLTVER